MIEEFMLLQMKPLPEMYWRFTFIYRIHENRMEKIEFNKFIHNLATILKAAEIHQRITNLAEEVKGKKVLINTLLLRSLKRLDTVVKMKFFLVGF